MYIIFNTNGISTNILKCTSGSSVLKNLQLRRSMFNANPRKNILEK